MNKPSDDKGQAANADSIRNSELNGALGVPMFKKDDWVIINNSKKSHVLIQGYNGFTTPCSSTGIVEQETMSAIDGQEKCRICEKHHQKFLRR